MMFFSDRYDADIHKIHIAHEYAFDRDHPCEYLSGRGQYGLVFALSGEVQYRFVDGGSVVMQEGDVLLLSPDAAYIAAATGVFRHYTVNFDLHPESSHLPPLENHYCLLLRTNTENYHQCFQKLVMQYSSEKAGSRMRTVASLYELLSLFFDDLSHVGNSGEKSARLLAAKTYMEQSFSQPFSLESLAGLCNMSVTNFRREWGKAFHETPMQYRDRIRLSHAKEYLSSGSYTVSEIASMCGYEDVSYFVRFFKKHTGMTPKAFMKRLIRL